MGIHPHPVLYIDDIPEGTPSRSDWTIIIPAAGTGSRLGYHQPKILYPLLGRPILDWLLDALQDVMHRVVLVLSPHARTQVEPQFFSRMGSQGRVVIQTEPRGMADAVLQAESEVRTPHCLVVWGDQATLSRRTIRRCALAHEQTGTPHLTLATIMKEQPYIHFQRDANGKIIRVQQAREGEIKERIGENDCGLFLFHAQTLFSTLHHCRDHGLARGSNTREFNLLQTLPLFEQKGGDVVTVRINDERETMGVNTPEEAKIVEEILKTMRSAGVPS
ncbi:MAG: NTP transferase domain-containing protein [Magnetococcales bacterium]|nr:NTP transferase domain-containing protein [Magnetococcales bacterium]MBF0172579.1 NTP transferase domain-containing protein [Magnetococcales bacterium]MBF0349339.1 NTP transferase domain-containing protein [Magnetococcales bacterium]